MNIVFNKCIFAYLCLFYSSTKYFHEFQSIFINFRFIDIFVKISTDISVITDILFLGHNVHLSFGFISTSKQFISF